MRTTPVIIKFRVTSVVFDRWYVLNTLWLKIVFSSIWVLRFLTSSFCFFEFYLEKPNASMDFVIFWSVILFRCSLSKTTWVFVRTRRQHCPLLLYIRLHHLLQTSWRIQWFFDIYDHHGVAIDTTASTYFSLHMHIFEFYFFSYGSK